MKLPDARLLIFAKAPIPGQAKTRLIPALGAEGAANLQAQLCQRTFALAATAAVATDVWCVPDPQHPFFLDFAGRYDFGWKTQHGADLGERMSNALRTTLLTHAPVVLIGTDSPDLQAHHLERAFGMLGGGYDAVLGPAADGGYVLIGLSRHEPQLFEGIDWGTEHVLRQTRERLAQTGFHWYELPTLRDIDRPEDVTANVLQALAPFAGRVGANK